MAKNKYYVVWHGRTPGIYQTWAECQKQVNGFKGARFKSFTSRQEAERAYESEHTDGESSHKEQTYIEESISVDAGTHGNPGPVEYQGVYTKDGHVLFAVEPFAKGTNNMGEFLAIVHALAWQKQEGMALPIYSDSQTAIGWVKKKKAKPTLARDETTEEIWQAIGRAESWLHHNDLTAPVLKWDTQAWGEIKADYDRK
ncbi:ribonuclease H [Natribacillus halophilus]|uniref:Ribonuclease H n=1 Tax=Natribacillus halophilus TaxID=549003 RepID=A0A1G8R366_9BACI|nr:ribonuclease H family protein [Natribacillus halophilus]SDJ11412.1 ribonuclease HI [Natribacillus halophilus]